MQKNAPLNTGFQRVNVIAAPAANTIFTFTANPRLIEQIVSIRYVLTTDANAANRRYFFNIIDGANNLLTIGTQLPDIASRVNQHNWIIGADSFSDGTASPNQIFNHKWPPNLIMPLAGVLTLVITNGQVGDQLSDIIVMTRTWVRT